MVTPGFTPPKTRTALRCWKRFSVRGAVLDSMRVKVETGTSSPLGRLDLEVEQRADGRAVLVADLRDDLVAAVEVVEAVDVARRRAACRAPGRRRRGRGRGRRAARGRSRRAPAGRSIFRSVSTYRNLPLCQPAPTTRPRSSEHLLGRRVALQHQLDVVLARRSAAAGRGAGTRAGRAPATRRRTPRRTSPRSSARARCQSLVTMPPKPPQAAVERPHELRLGERGDASRRPRSDSRFDRLERRVGRGLEEQADVALVLDGRELLCARTCTAARPRP